MADKKPFINFDNHVSIGHIFTSISVLITAIFFVANVDNRVTALEKADIQINQVIERRDAATSKQFDDLRNDSKENIKEIKTILMRIEDKVDRKADKQ